MASLKTDYIKTTCGKMNSGPGDWHCPCCNPFRTIARKMKTGARRRLRRHNKQQNLTPSEE